MMDRPTYGAVPVSEEWGTPEPTRTLATQPRSTRSSTAAVVVIFALAGVVGYLAGGRSAAPAAAPALESHGMTADPVSTYTDTEFTVTNDYTRASGAIGMGYPWIEPYKLAEPFRKSTFSVTAPNAECAYSWSLHQDGAVLFDATGTSFVVELNKTGLVTVMVTQLDGEGNSTGDCSGLTTTSHVQSRYVRRELRSLTQDDLTEWFDTLEVIFKTACTEGKKKYGSKWECIDTLTKWHNELAGDSYCDRMHDGYGLITQHAALTRWFEVVLRTVNPAVSAHYWDYSIEGELANITGDIDVWRHSRVFADDMFGPAHGNGIVTEGRFGYTRVKSKAQNFTKMYNAYGYMRAPWNQNPYPYVTRFNTTYGINFKGVPGCRAHQKLLEEVNFKRFGKYVAYWPHGTTHMMIGGIGHADMATELLAMGYDMEVAREWVPVAFAFQKNMWRGGMLNCPDTCSADTPMSECKCTCWNSTGYAEYSDEQLWDKILFRVLATNEAYAYNKSGHFVGHEIIKMMCNNYDRMAPVMGDSLESASPNDVSFWPTHPTIERLFTWRRLNHFNSTTWPDDDAWSVRGFQTDYCNGHNLNDTLVWPNHIYAPTLTGPYKNSDVWDLTDPTEQYLDYVYDSFEWPHCEGSGYPVTLIDTDILTKA